MSWEVTSEFAGLLVQVHLGLSLFHIMFVMFKEAKTNPSTFMPQRLSFQMQDVAR
jgi:hypothetical protein